MLCTHKTTSSASLDLKFDLSSTTHISTNSHPFLVGLYQYPELWYINCLNCTIELHLILYQYVVNHQMQADSIAKHLCTASVTSLSYEAYVETIRAFCQTIDHTNHKAVQEKSHRKALQAKFNGGCNGNRGGRTGGGGRNSGRGGGRQPNQTGRGCRKYHNWIPKEQFDNLDEEGYQHFISGAALVVAKYKRIHQIRILHLPLVQPILIPRRLPHRYRSLGLPLPRRHSLFLLG